MEDPLADVIEPSPYDVAIYFENSPEQVKLVRAHCNTRELYIVKVQDSQPKPSIIESVAAELGFTRANNAYVDMRVTKERAKYNRQAGEMYDPVSGIRPLQINEMNAWLIRTQGKRRIALFDWDRTLSVFEGVSLMEADRLDFRDEQGRPFYPIEKIREDTLLFILGGQERLDMLKQMFRILHANNVDIAIVTNNLSCPDERMYPFFHGLAQQLMPKDKNNRPIPFRVICSLPFNKGNKGLALAHSFPNLCTTEPAGRDTSPKR